MYKPRKEKAPLLFYIYSLCQLPDIAAQILGYNIYQEESRQKTLAFTQSGFVHRISINQSFRLFAIISPSF